MNNRMDKFCYDLLKLILCDNLLLKSWPHVILVNKQFKTVIFDTCLILKLWKITYNIEHTYYIKSGYTSPDSSYQFKVYDLTNPIISPNKDHQISDIYNIKKRLSKRCITDKSMIITDQHSTVYDVRLTA